MNKPILVTRPSMPELSEYVKEISDIWETHWLSNMGDKHNKFETLLLDYLKTSNLTLFTNGHLALEGALEAFDLTGEVITPPFTFISTTHAIVSQGLKPVFCDINPYDYTIDVNKIERLITEKTTAILPIHVYGHLCDFETIAKIAKKYQLKVIYDAAHAFGITIDGNNVANFGDASMFSFHATKVFNTIEGGMLTYKDGSLTNRLNNIKNYGITGPEASEYIGANAKMNEFQAAMGICNLRHIETEITKRKIIFEKYIDMLKDIKGIKISIPDSNTKYNYSYFPVVFENYKYTRNEIINKLKKQNIFARKYFYPITSNYDCYDKIFDSDKTPVAKYISERILTLPIYSDLNPKYVDKICQIILN